MRASAARDARDGTRFMYTFGWPRAPPPPSHAITRFPTSLTGCSAIRSMAKFSFTWNETERKAHVAKYKSGTISQNLCLRTGRPHTQVLPAQAPRHVLVGSHPVFNMLTTHAHTHVTSHPDTTPNSQKRGRNQVTNTCPWSYPRGGPEPPHCAPASTPALLPAPRLAPPVTCRKAPRAGCPRRQRPRSHGARKLWQTPTAAPKGQPVRGNTAWSNTGQHGTPERRRGCNRRDRNPTNMLKSGISPI